MIQAKNVLLYAVPEKLNLPAKFKDPGTIIIRGNNLRTSLRHVPPSLLQKDSVALTSSA